MSSAPSDADQDAGLREEIARAGFAGWYGRDEYDEHPVQGMWERAADAIMRGPLATLRARATAAEAELAGVWAIVGSRARENQQLEARATAAEDKLRDREAEIERLTGEMRGWKGVAVIAAIPLEAMRMAGSYRVLAPSTQACVDEAVATIRMAVAGHSLPPEGDIDAALAPVRAALASTDHPASSEEATDVR